MLNGVMVDPLTDQFLGVATDKELGTEVYEALKDFFHNARNRLSSLKIGLYLARRSCDENQAPIWAELDQSYRGLETLVERLQEICRPSKHDPVEGDLSPWFRERRSTWEEWFAARGRQLDWAPPDAPVAGRFDPLGLVRGLDALLAWRAGEGASEDSARLSWSTDATRLRVDWSEPDHAVEGPLEGCDRRGISMALPLLARTMAAHGGTMAVERRDGFHIRLAWPIGEVSSAESA